MTKLFLSILLFFAEPFTAFSKPTVEKGFVDLSHWSGRNSAKLDGEWLFFSNQLLEPQAAWDALQKPQHTAEYLAPGQRFTNTRMGTYLLRIQTSRVLSQLWIADIGVYTSARIFVFEGSPGAGLLPIQELGSVGTNAEEQEVFISRSKPFVFEKKTAEDLFLLIQVADFHHYWSGLWVPPSLSAQPETFAISPGYLSCILAGILFFAFVQNLSLALGRREDLVGRDMAVMTGLMALRAGLQAFYSLLSEYNGPFLQDTYESHLDLLYCTLILGCTYFYSFALNCFPSSEWRMPERPLFVTALILCVGLILLPMARSEAWLLAVDAYLFFLGFGCSLIVLRAVQQKMDEAWISMVGILVLFAGGLSSLSWVLGDSAQVQFGIEIGLTIFIYCQTQILSRRFTRTLHRLEEITHSLDTKDKIRTQFLQNTSHALRAPLNGMLVYLDLLQRDHFGSLSESVRLQLSKIQKLGESQKSHVDAILNLAEAKHKDIHELSEKEQLSTISDNLASIADNRAARPNKTKRAYSQTFHILVVDDNNDNCELMSEILKLDSHRVSIAKGGKEGLEIMVREHPDLLLLDLMMPDMSGEDVVRQMKATEALRDIPIILITALATENDRLKGLQLGADDYLTKPLVVEELRLRVRNLLDRLELHRVLADQEYKDKMAQLGELLADLSHEMKNIYQGIDNAELNPTERLQYVTRLLPLPEHQRGLLGQQLPLRVMDGKFHERENWMTAPDKQHPSLRDLRYLRFTIALLPISETEARGLWTTIAALPENDIHTISQCLHLLSNHLQLVDVALRSRELIDAILGFNRLESENQTFKLKDTVHRTLNLLQARMSKSGIELRCEIEDIEAQGSSSSVQQILLNLINNAIDTLNGPGDIDRWIRIETMLESGQPILKVSNSGAPIAAEHRAKLFERGFTTKGKRGSGIGLFVSRRLARRMNGELELSLFSTHTCFVLHLPPARSQPLAKAS